MIINTIKDIYDNISVIKQDLTKEQIKELIKYTENIEEILIKEKKE